jgi:hypothetical protein
MIHEIGVELAAYLRANRVPFPVVDGPEGTESITFARERIVIEHDSSDSFNAPRSESINPKIRMIRDIGIKLSIFARSPAPGAADFEHRRRAENVLDAVLCGLHTVTVARRNGWTPKGGGFAKLVDREGSIVQGGALYELKATIERGVSERTWAGDINPEFAFGSDQLVSTTRVSGPSSIDGLPPDAETACGA